MIGKYFEYDKEDSLIFEGQYKDGGKNGKGKIIKEGITIFEGEFLNGKRWNGNGYDFKGNIVYKLKNGNGFVKEYNPDNSLLFEGNYINGEKNGYIKEYNISGNLVFEGNYVDGKRNGFGKEYIQTEILLFPFSCYCIKNNLNMINEEYDDYLYYEGEYKTELRDEKEKENVEKEKENVEKDLVYEGEYLNGLRNGYGKEYKNGKLIFEGEYLNGERKYNY